jgi:hypothetical protein
MQNLQELHIKVIEVAKYLPDCMKLIFNVPLLGPIVDELLNILHTSVATVKTSTFEKCVITGAINYVKS